ncbi:MULTISPECIES: ACT domain-containing protein [Maribellus]|uniref:ACT domain-containing protein n=1 Tax=Maribellus comscasis TaxID=2681766 RepID=A0A6I6KB57_9BACT|nr:MULTISPECIES: ACT domain-containing protein [Maribellus]MCG6190575.1 ACT domain-containing protein [Maribellus maritimus]QGY47444.1 ACT domain-containing protein [Maribellus comscasis]
MITKQVSVFLENKSGRLNEVTQILSDAEINISAFTIADTSDFGILRLIVSDPEKACEVLKQNQFSVKTTEVVLAKTPNQPGSLSKLLKVLSEGGSFIEYMYAFSMEQDSATIVIRPASIKKCMEILQSNKDNFLFQEGEFLL